MTKTITYPFTESFLDNLIDYIDTAYLKPGKDLNRLAIVFGGKRPALFLKRELARRIKHSFFPPHFFTIDDFIYDTISQKEVFASPKDLDSSFVLYQLVKKHTPHILRGREAFAQFLPWTREILSFIDQLDLEDIAVDRLRHIEDNARIGYPVPKDINRLLSEIVTLRKAYHEHLVKERVYSRGFQYLRASQLIKEVTFDKFDQILFCNFFYFHRTEETIVKSLYERDKATLIFQGDERKWPALTRISKSFGTPIQEGKTVTPTTFDLKLYACPDGHAQVAMVRELLKPIKNPEKTVIVLPNPDHIVPLLSEITSVAKDFNISMGYPLKRSSLYSLFEFVFKAQTGRRADGYYAKDYLRVLRHPFVKNLKLSEDQSVARVLIHKTEEILTGEVLTSMSGSIFIDPHELAENEELYEISKETLYAVGFTGQTQELKSIMRQLNDLLFFEWEKVETFAEFAEILERFLDTFLKKSFLRHYPLNLNIAAKMLDIKEELQAAAFSAEVFPQGEIFKIFENKVEREIVAFKGSPLKGLQVLGLFETRSLNFENVIVIDTNEGVLPRLKIYEPLIPREVMVSLGLDRLELEEEIQRYQFMRLISSAKKVHLIYQETRDKEKSRFVEELVWEQQKKLNRLDAISVTKPGFEVKVSARRHEVFKTPQMIEALRQHRFSASSVNMYLRNPLEFYYNYCLGLREKEDLLDEPEARHVGTFVHELLEQSFKRFLGKSPSIDAQFRQFFMRSFDERFAATFGRGRKSDAFLLRSVLNARLNRFLDKEGEEDRKIKELLFVERRFDDTISLSCGQMRFTYRVDRVDKMPDGSIMILDYKTGSVDPMPRAIDKIESLKLSREAIYQNVISFQMPLYFQYLDKQYPNDPINAAFYNLRTMELKRFVENPAAQERKRINTVFMRALDFTMCEIFDPNVPFVQGEVL